MHHQEEPDMLPIATVGGRRSSKRFIIAASSVFLPASLVIAQDPAAPATDDEWKRRTEQRLQELEQTVKQKDAELERLRSQVDGVTETQQAVQRDAESRKSWTPFSGDPEASNETTTPSFFDVNKFAAQGDFPGSIRIPGSKTSIQIGGFTQVDAMFDFDRIGSRDNFVVNSIPTDIEGAGQTNFSARQTRLFLKTVTPTEGWGPLTTYVEGDFFGSNNTAELRLRHAYGEIGKDHRLLAGQTWSSFVDASSFPGLLDQQGAAGQMLTRRPQFRYTQTLKKGMDWAVSVEDPNAGITNTTTAAGEARARFPALASNVRWNGDWGHAQVAALVRRVTFDPDVGSREDDYGWGVNLTGGIKVLERDQVLFQAAVGEAIADYMNDSSGLGLDAVYDGDDLESLPTFGGVIAYQHWWDKKWDSYVVYSYASVDNADAQGPEAYHAGHYAAVNLRWHPAERVMMGVEYLYGVREDNDGDKGYASRVQASVQYKF
jgi:hypothetical protein